MPISSEFVMTYRILVPLDGSDLADGALPLATALVEKSQGALAVTRVHLPSVPIGSVGDLGLPLYDPAWDETLRQAAEEALHKSAAQVQAKFGIAATATLRSGSNIGAEIEAAAEEFRADLIAMTTHGHGGQSLAWIGSVADAVVRTTHRPVLVIPDRAVSRGTSMRRILVPHDGSTPSETALVAATGLAKLCRASIALVRVVAPPVIGDVLTALSSEALDRFGVDEIAAEAKEELDRRAEMLRAEGLTVTATVLINANPARAILEHLNECDPDLIAMGTHGRGFSRLFVGSVADKVLRGSGRAVLLQRPPAVA
jgi:nucleotide-binding universal stress UspA family protein